MTHASPRHRAIKEPAQRIPRRGPSPRTLAIAAVSGVLLTGGAVGVQTVVEGSADRAAASSATTAEGDAPLATDRADTASRGDQRPPIDASAAADLFEKAAAKKAAADRAAEEKAKAAQKKAEAEEKAAAALEAARANPRGVAQQMVADRGWDASQFSCLDALWSGESGWNYKATNPSSGAYGIPQSLPASKMAAAGDDWESNPTTQITWGLDYIKAAYGTPCSAQSFKSGNGFY